MSARTVDAAETSGADAARPIHVMVVDDSAVIRGLLTRTLEEDSEITVIASVGNGEAALSALQRSVVDVIVLDIEMPVMDGLTALPKLLAIAPGIKVIIASTLSKRNAQVSLKALASGAADYIAKPSSAGEMNAAGDFRRDLVAKVKTLGAVRRAGTAGKRMVTAGERAAPRITARPHGPIVLRSPSTTLPEILAIGSSTGGPQALFALFRALPATLKQPILITQHMPATFTTILAEHLTRASGRTAQEGVDGEPVVRGRIYVAPGDFHMKVEAKGTERVIRLTKEPPENFCRPAVDPMFRSLAQIYGPAVLSVVLTGMGSDGAKGGQAIVAAGGTVIAQDEATSVVWGMPGAAAAAGICSAVLPLADIGPQIMRLAVRGA
jgi:two-component system, chemotaxis family, protein-glutamate methylesterase/glutaminase